MRLLYFPPRAGGRAPVFLDPMWASRMLRGLVLGIKNFFWFLKKYPKYKIIKHVKN